MALINQTPFKIIATPARTIIRSHGPIHREPDHGPRKVPIPLDSSEGFFFHHLPVYFSISTATNKYTVGLQGFIYLTNRRLVLIAAEATPTFESFVIKLDEVYSISTGWSIRPETVVVHVSTVDDDNFKLEITFDTGARDRCVVFKDYLKMIMETTAAASRRQNLDLTLTNMTSMAILEEMPRNNADILPSYGETIGDMASRPEHNHSLPPSYSA